MFFLLRKTPLEVSPANLSGLRLSLNTPVVSGSDLPVGPARAAIVVHAESGGGPAVTVGVRSLKTGQVVLYSYDGELGGDSPLSVGSDAALSFGEGMGFLFDEDEVRDGDAGTRELAYGLWVELMGGGAAPPGAAPVEQPLAAAPDSPAEPQTEAAELSPEPVLELAEPAAQPLPEPAEEPPAGAPLSKFRRSPMPEGGAAEPRREDGSGASEEPRRAALGRLKLVKRRRGGAAAEERRSWVLRLLSAF